MAVEIANVLHAMAILNLADVPADQILVKSQGVRSVARESAGVFSVTLEVPLGGFLSGIAQATHAAGTARLVDCRLENADVPNNLVIFGRTVAGAPADTGECYLMVWRFPVT